MQDTSDGQEKGRGASIANFVFRVEMIGFAFLVIMSWLVEAVRLPHYLFNEPFDPSWHRSIMRTLVIGVTWAWVHWMTKPLLKRLHDLEEFVHSCSSRPNPAKIAEEPPVTLRKSAPAGKLPGQLASRYS